MFPVTAAHGRRGSTKDTALPAAAFTRRVASHGPATSRPRSSLGRLPPHRAGSLTARDPSTALASGDVRGSGHAGTSARGGSRQGPAGGHSHRMIIKRRKSLQAATGVNAAAHQQRIAARQVFGALDAVHNAAKHGSAHKPKPPKGGTGTAGDSSAVPRPATTSQDGGSDRRVTLSQKLRQNAQIILALQAQLKEARDALEARASAEKDVETAADRARESAEAELRRMRMELVEARTARDKLQQQVAQLKVQAPCTGSGNVETAAVGGDDGRVALLEQELAAQKAQVATCTAALQRSEQVMTDLLTAKDMLSAKGKDALVNAKNRAELGVLTTKQRMEDLTKEHGEEMGQLTEQKAHLVARVAVLATNAQHLRAALLRKQAQLDAKAGPKTPKKVVKVMSVVAPPAPYAAPHSPAPVPALPVRSSPSPKPSPGTKAALEALRAEVQRHKDALAAKSASLEGITAELAGVKSHNKDLQRDAGAAAAESKRLKQEAAQAKKALQAAEAAHAAATSRVKELEARAKDAAAVAKQLAGAQNKITEQQQELLTLQAAASRRAQGDKAARDQELRATRAEKDAAAWKAKADALASELKDAKSKAAERIRSVRATSQADLTRLRSQLAAAQAECQKLEASMRGSRASAEEARREAADLVSKLEACRAQASAGVQASTQLEAANDALAKLRGELDSLRKLRDEEGQRARHELTDATTRALDLESQLNASKEQCERLSQAYADAKRLQPQFRLAKEELERVRLQLKESEDMVESQGHQLASRQARIEQLESQLGDELAKLKQLSAEATAAATTARNLSDAQGQVKALQLNLARADTREAELLEKLARAESERSSAQTEASQAREKASKLERQLASALADVRRLDSLTAVQRQKLEDMAAELASREKALSSARSEHGAAVKALRHRLAAAEARTSRQSTNDALARQQLEEETAALQRELDTTRKDAAHARRGASEARRELGRKQVELDAAAAALKQAQDTAAGASGATDRALSSLAKKHRLALANEKDRAITAENSLMAAKLRIERLEQELADAQKGRRTAAAAAREAKRRTAGPQAGELQACKATIKDLQQQLADALRKLEAATAEAASKPTPAQLAQRAKDQAAELAERIRKGLDAEMKARESVFNMKILFKAAENAEMQKEMEKLKKEVDQQREKVNIMLYNVKSAEKVLSKFDREAAKKHAKARDEQFKVLSEKISKARKNSKSFKNASVVNVTRLNELMPKTKAKVADAVKQRGKLIDKLKQCLAS